MKNRSIDLHNILFAQLEKLVDEDLDGEKLTQEIRRADMVNKTSSQIINNGRLTYDILRFSAEYPNIELPEHFEKGPKLLPPGKIAKR